MGGVKCGVWRYEESSVTTWILDLGNVMTAWFCVATAFVSLEIKIHRSLVGKSWRASTAPGLIG
jgi:hypothetical protein